MTVTTIEHSSPDQERLARKLAEKACLGELDSQDFIQLDELLSSHPDLQKIYIEYIELHSEIEHLAHENCDAVRFRRPQPAMTSRLLPFLLSACAALLVGLMGTWAFMTWNQKPVQVAVVPDVAVPKEPLAKVNSFSPVAQWSIAGEAAQSLIWPQSHIQIEEGHLRIDFRNGIILTAQGPADFFVQDEMLVQLTSGTLRASLPDQVSGFRITSGTLEMTDLGTEFYFQQETSGRAQAFVTQGHCQLKLSSDMNAPARPVVAGAGFAATAEGVVSPLSGQDITTFLETVVSDFLRFEYHLRAVSASVSIMKFDGEALDVNHRSARKQIYLIPEQRGITVEQPIGITDLTTGEGVTLPAGTKLDSFLLHNAPGLPVPGQPASRKEIATTGTILFERPVFAVVGTLDDLMHTDEVFATSQARFVNDEHRPVDHSDQMQLDANDKRRLSVRFGAHVSGYDQVRILCLVEDLAESELINP